MQPFFSVVVPAYNRAHLLPRCIASLSAQRDSDFEIVVVDDGSTDNTASTVSEQAKTSPVPLHYIHQSNQGAGQARNTGAERASGEFLLFLDSDDEVNPEWLERMHDTIRSTSADIVSCGAEFIDVDGKRRSVRLPGPQDSPVVLHRGYFFTGTFAVRKAVFDAVGGYTPGLPANQHSELRMRLLPHCEANALKMVCISEPLVRRHSHAGPSIRSDVRAVVESGEFVLREYGELLKQDAGSYADWAAAVGCGSARLGRHTSARRWFASAIHEYPRGLKNYFRLAVTCMPGVRALLWGSSDR